eukprot:gene16799-biopygen4761
MPFVFGRSVHVPACTIQYLFLELDLDRRHIDTLGASFTVGDRTARQRCPIAYSEAPRYSPERSGIHRARTFFRGIF